MSACVRSHAHRDKGKCVHAWSNSAGVVWTRWGWDCLCILAWATYACEMLHEHVDTSASVYGQGI